ncbi:MAG: hypothetical protein ABSH04_07500 [Acidimicrobiales bacterium]
MTEFSGRVHDDHGSTLRPACVHELLGAGLVGEASVDVDPTRLDKDPGSTRFSVSEGGVLARRVGDPLAGRGPSALARARDRSDRSRVDTCTNPEAPAASLPRG